MVFSGLAELREWRHIGGVRPGVQGGEGNEEVCRGGIGGTSVALLILLSGGVGMCLGN